MKFTLAGTWTARLAACLALATVGETHAAPLLGLGGASPRSSAAPSELVTLLTSNVDCLPPGSQAIDTRVLPDGSTQPFTIPSGRVLVITAAEAIARSDQSLIGDLVGVFLLAGESDVNTFATKEGILQDGGVAGSLTVDWTFPNGVVIQPGVKLCALARDESASVTGARVERAFVHGFLAADR